MAIDAAPPPRVRPTTRARLTNALAIVAVTTVIAAAVVVPASDSALGASRSSRSASTATWRAQLLAPVPASTRAYVVEGARLSCARRPTLRLVPVSVGGDVGAARSLPPYRSMNCQSLGTISSVAFATADDGIVLEYSAAGLPSLYVTTDGARSWRARPLVDATTSGSARDYEVTPRGITYVTTRCASDFWCRDFTLESSSWSSPPWHAMPLPVPATQGGVVQAQYGSALWVYELHRGGVSMYFSATGRPPFAHWPADPIGSVVACDLTPTSLTHLWAECPTGMMVSFLTSNDGGRTWRAVSQYQFAGTGGGTFDPVSSSLAFLDYGSDATISHDDLFRIDGAGHATPVGRFACTNDGAMDFSSERVGIALCLSPTSGSSRSILYRTTDGGHTWVVVGLGA